MPDRAVSEVVSFILVFALITTSVGMVSVFGLQGLQNARDAERINNGERAFEVLADNQRDIVYGSAPSRSTEVKLASTSLTITESSTAELTRSDGTSVGSAGSRAITFDMAGGGANVTHGVVYEMGAVIRVDRGSSVMRREPPFQFGENRTVIHFIALQSRTGEVQRRTGSTTVLVRSDRGSTTMLAHEQPTGDVTLTINTTASRAKAWKRYLETEIDGLGGTCEPLDGDGSVSCSFQTDDLRVSRTTIRAALS